MRKLTTRDSYQGRTVYGAVAWLRADEESEVYAEKCGCPGQAQGLDPTDEWVSITLRPIQEKTWSLSNLLEVRGGDFKDADEIDTYIRSERDSWDQ